MSGIVPLMVALSSMGDSIPAALSARENALFTRSSSAGLGSAIAEALDDRIVLVYPGAPVAIGREQAASLLSAQPALDSLSATWARTEGWTSRDGTLAVTVGASRIVSRHGGAERGRGTYLAAWVTDGKEWRLAALTVTGVGQASGRPARARGPVELPPAEPSGPAADFIRADLDFAARAAARGAASAFQAFAAPNAVMQPGPGVVRRGPEEIGRGIAAGPAAEWTWYPVVARAAPSGDLGFTVGQAEIRPKAGGEPRFSKYLTIWTRVPDGTVRFLSDGGNPRPRAGTRR